jgi:hypothetical protein
LQKKDISAWSEEIAEAFKEGADNFSNEMELREHVHRAILDALKDLYGLGVSATAGEINTKKTGPRSPLDRLYGGVAVEWEWDMKPARREHGAQQALDYLANLQTNFADKRAFTAVVADGKQWGFLRFDPFADQDLFTHLAPATAAEHFTWAPNSPGAVRQFLELVGAHDKSPISSRSLTAKFGPTSQVASRLVTVLGQSMAGRLPLDRTDTLYVEWRRALDVVYGDLSETDSALAVEVQDSYRVPVARPLGEMLFVLHTYFALIGRVIAVELLAVAVGTEDEAPSTWRAYDNESLLRELRQLESGRLPGDLEISNLFEADLFSWWTDRAASNSDLLDVVRDVLKEISELAFPTIAFGPQRGGDVLRDLYQALIPNKLRKALGEFLTPYWLADACLQRLREQGADLTDGRVLDPTCGTGTFIVPIITERLNRLSRLRGVDVSATDVQAALDSVTGIDLNPVAVVATRVNFVIALGDLARVGELTLPVWRADSLVVPEATHHQELDGPIAGIRHMRVTTSLPEPFTIPVSMATATQIARLRHMVEECVPPASLKDPEEIARRRDDFAARFASQFSSSGLHPLDPQFLFEDESKVAMVLYDQITELSLAGRNGVWARLIENAFAPLFAGKFDTIVGNPPWLTWTKLPKSWRDQSEALWRQSGLWYTPNEASDSFSLQSADIATLVFAVSIERYAAPGGVVGLLTPNALISADPGGRAFRQFRIKPDARDSEAFPAINVPFRALWVDDWSKMNPFAPDAANKPIFLIVKKGETQLPDTPAAVWKRTPGAKIKGRSWREIRPVLQESLGAFAPVDSATPTSAWRFQDASLPELIKGGTNRYVFGKGLDTRGANGIYFVDVSHPHGAQGAQKATAQVSNRPEEGRKKPQQTKGRMELDLLYPLLRGRDVSHWFAEPQTYFALPHNPAALDQPLTAAVFQSQYPAGNTWFNRHREFLRGRKTPPARNWNMTPGGNDWCRVDGALQHMTGQHVVVVRELSERPAAAMVETKANFDLGGRTVAPLIDHKLMFCSVASREEALYLTAMINSTPIQDLLASFVNSTSVSPKSMKRLPIPDFDDSNEEIGALVELAEQVMSATKRADVLEQLQAQMDAAVLRVVVAGEEYRPQPIRPARRTGPKIRPTSDDPKLF